MFQGQTVFYSLSEENVFDIRHMRGVKATEPFDLNDPVEPPTHQIWQGSPVEIGMICPAEVFKAYSLYEHCAENNLMLPEGVSLAEGRKSFSGYADLRVHLPGNDVLWVPRAEYDPNPKPVPQGESFGVGNTVVPEPGRFTPVYPTSLLF